METDHHMAHGRFWLACPPLNTQNILIIVDLGGIVSWRSGVEYFLIQPFSPVVSVVARSHSWPRVCRCLNSPQVGVFRVFPIWICHSFNYWCRLNLSCLNHSQLCPAQLFLLKIADFFIGSGAAWEVLMRWSTPTPSSSESASRWSRLSRGLDGGLKVGFVT